MFSIGKTKINNDVMMAPMAGITDAAYIKICEEMGTSYAITELISSEAIVRNNKKTFDMLNGLEDIKIPYAIQLFGSNPNTIAEAAKIVSTRYPKAHININMGCPVPKVALSSKSGSALLKDPDKVYEIVKATVEAVDVPVTVKIRSGWDKDSINALEIAKKIEKAKAKAIIIHARTRSQGYKGEVDLDIIKEIKNTVNIPVIGNGDITDCYKAKKMKDYTHCDGIMIGRGIIGNPWLIKECIDYLGNGKTPQEISLKEKNKVIKKHMNLLIKYKSEKLAILEIRTHIAHYLKGIKGSKTLKQNIYKATNKEEIFLLLDKYLQDS